MNSNRPLIDFSLYLITDRHQAAFSLIDLIQEAIDAGVRAIQFREKDLSLREQLTLIEKIEKITKPNGVKLFINDRIDLCLAIDADGVQLPADGFSISVARELLGQSKAIGVSCHSVEAVLQAQSEKADFALLGPIYDTPSKRVYGAPLGLDYFRLAKQATTIPLFAVGGVGESQIADLLDAGANGIAIISSIMGSPNVGVQCKALLRALG